MSFLLLTGLFLGLSGCNQSQTVYDTAVQVDRPDYVPRYSDVVMRSLLPYKANTTGWRHNTLAAAKAYHATCMYWVYPGTDETWVNDMRAEGYTIQPSIHHWMADYPDSWEDVENRKYEFGRGLNVYGNPVTPLPARVSGCCNRWEYRQVWLSWAKTYVDMGTAASIQQDAPHCNYMMTSASPGDDPTMAGP